ncbi:LOW QUALITY PROTEIN: hypothetical protein BRADI_3g54372v3 [Brachypodium distachyon]|uniref:BTB domain-containing protein n=1 Tax=Brachypodium distachyon TaxID=15368 RepID=A0A2K2D522_BRADI|nr:LOW QUALITY PROTEIN: hypothetical protein BRADI_3g54372v3 [Brachypodium distachyon]
MSSSGAHQAGGQSSRSASPITADWSSGHLHLKIHGYSGTTNLPTGQFSSDYFSLGGHRWRVDYYPNGVRADVADYISLCLVLAQDAPPPVKVQCELSLVSESGEEHVVPPVAWAWVDTFFSPYGRLCCSRRAVLEASKHLGPDGSLTIRCDVIKKFAPEEIAAFVPVHPSDLARNLGELLETGKGADVVFEVGGKTFAAHRCVLAALSSVFAAELFGPMKESNTAPGVVRIPDMDPEVFKALLHFAYTGSLPEIPKERESMAFQHLLVAADRYKMERLKLICEQKLCEHIDRDTVASIFAVAGQHHCAGLKKACFRFVDCPENLVALLGSDSFKHLIRSCPDLVSELVELVAKAMKP